MSPRKSAARPSLQSTIDKEVYHIVRKLHDEQQTTSEQPLHTQVPHYYQQISRSNSSLSRRPKKVLEDSISRVLQVIKADLSEEEKDEQEPDNLGDQTPDNNQFNRSIVSQWKKAAKRDMSDSSTKPVADRVTNGEPPKKKRKQDKYKPPTHVSLDSIGGVNSIIGDLLDIMVGPLLAPQVYTTIGLQAPAAALLHGPPGCGKTLLANVIAAELGVPFIKISAPSIVSGMSGESEKALREHFEEATKIAPCLMFIDEIDAIAPKRDNAQREMEKRIVAQLLTCMDDLEAGTRAGKPVFVLAATNRPDSVDPALRRGGRFEHEFLMPIPSSSAREKILQTLTRSMRLENVDLHEIATQTPGFVGADLSSLVTTAGSAAIKRYLSTPRDAMDVEARDTEMSFHDEMRQKIINAKEKTGITPDLAILGEDFAKALSKTTPSTMREGFASIPDTTFDEVGALPQECKALDLAIVRRIAHPETYAKVAVLPPDGVLLWGPPGCGKTLLAKATANAANASFISVKGSEILSKYVGESERAIRVLFQRARNAVPCLIFLDEIDALVPRRNTSQTEVTNRVVNSLLTELGGLEGNEGIFVIAATNRPDVIDSAILRPGRIGQHIYIGLPSVTGRAEIICRQLQRHQINIDHASPTLSSIADRAEGFSGADLENLIRKAGEIAVDRNSELKLEHLVEALTMVKASVLSVELKRYNSLKEKMGLGFGNFESAASAGAD